MRCLTHFVTHRKPLRSLTLVVCFQVSVHADLGGRELSEQCLLSPFIVAVSAQATGPLEP